MKLKPNCLEFYDIGELITFIERFHLNNCFQLANQLIDNSGTVMVKSHSLISDAILKRLISIQEDFEPTFKILINRDLQNRLNPILAKKIYKRIDVQDNTIANFLLNNSERKVDILSLIENAFTDPAISLALLYFYTTEPEFFNYMADMGLLTMSITLQNPEYFKFLTRYSFLSGLFCDLSMAGSNFYKIQNFTEAQFKELSSISAHFCDKINLPYEVVSIVETPVITIVDDAKPVHINMDNLKENVFFREVSRTAPSQRDEFSEEVIRHVLEAMKIARFIKEMNRRLGEDKDPGSKILTMFSYNIEKGFFEGQLPKKVVSRFKQYSELLDNIKRIAEIEKSCPFESAWAYPKPRSTQVLCQKKLEKCPLSIRGRDINIVNPLNPFGYIGKRMEKGYYPKCKLEAKLVKPAKNVVEQIEKEEKSETPEVV
ncbi:MAG: hypothetical protein H7A25_05100 [Leptospiraceae bacterium]|nr:hypothetical protein [Leptospiraceae bacterium]MCP5499256.1 hypothetical protein [Leptospiraceae bacterium]